MACIKIFWLPYQRSGEYQQPKPVPDDLARDKPLQELVSVERGRGVTLAELLLARLLLPAHRQDL